MDHLIGENPDLWGVIQDGPTIPMKTATYGITRTSKERKEWDAADKLAIQNNAKAKKIKRTTSEKGKDIKKDKFIPSNRRMTSQEADISMKKAFATMGTHSTKNLMMGSVRRKQKKWYLDSACPRYITGDKSNFLSLKNFKGGNVAFGNGKSGEIQGIG
ncbi:uncharacterized protein [Solanum lycopersicum]|uniref:uncharacterized protein n=1 Tax=Solanum lycopersicum TaxID=4081 RepID=UPI0037485D2F